MSIPKHDLTQLMSSKNVVARLLAFGILAPLTVYLIDPVTFPQDQWPYLLTLFWGLCLVSLIPIGLRDLSSTRMVMIERLLIDMESVIAGIWASTFGFDIITIWGIIAAGVFNHVGVHGLLGVVRMILSCALGITLGFLWLDIPLEPTMRTEIALVVLPCFLFFMVSVSLLNLRNLDQ